MNPTLQTPSRSVTGISPNILSGMDGRGGLCGVELFGLAAQVNHLLNLESAYKAVCEKREKIPFKWGSQPDRDALQERANELSGEIMRTERRIIEGLKAFASGRATLSEPEQIAACWEEARLNGGIT